MNEKLYCEKCVKTTDVIITLLKEVGDKGLLLLRKKKKKFHPLNVKRLGKNAEF